MRELAERRKGDVEHARTGLKEAQSREAARRQVAFASVQTWKDAVTAGELAATKVKEADRHLKPVSVLLSKKEGPRLHSPGLEGRLRGAHNLQRPRPSDRYPSLHRHQWRRGRQGEVVGYLPYRLEPRAKT